MPGGTGSICEDTKHKGAATILSRATSTSGERQPNRATWNVLGYCNNGIQEHGVSIQVIKIEIDNGIRWYEQWNISFLVTT
jgi:hypothetical protein